MKLFVAVTDGQWFRFLRDQSPLDEVNFWLPRPRHAFRALEPGEPFLFKLHAPEHAIAGGGYFTRYTQAPVSLAWEAFGEKNGAYSFDDLYSRIASYRGTEPSTEDFEIGCVMLAHPFFLTSADWIAPPEDWSRNIVRGKGYDTEEGEGRRLWQEVLPLISIPELARPTPTLDPPAPPYGGPTRGDPVPMRPRLGQGIFRMAITDAYRRRCAVTGERALPTLEAAHILPVARGGAHEVANGLLLRSDVHRLYDAGYVTVTPDLTFRVSRRLRTDFDDGEPYFPYDGVEIAVPDASRDRPDPLRLEWHADACFKG
jgi:putative restriction endonuclease